MHELDHYASDINGRMLRVIHGIWSGQRTEADGAKRAGIVQWSAADQRLGSFEATIRRHRVPRTFASNYVIAGANVRRNDASITVAYLGFQALHPVIHDDDRFALYFLEGLEEAHKNLIECEFIPVS